VPRPSNEMLSQVPLFAGLEPRDLDRIGDVKTSRRADIPLLDKELREVRG